MLSPTLHDTLITFFVRGKPMHPKPSPTFKFIILLAITLFISACGEIKLPPIPPNGTILAFGDSLTQGKGVKPADSYPSVLARLSGRKVINAGVSGEVSQAG
ncbi:MAG: acyl-CoA thioesterase-1, partial [Phenylobacterium sp.]